MGKGREEGERKKGEGEGNYVTGREGGRERGGEGEREGKGGRNRHPFTIFDLDVEVSPLKSIKDMSCLQLSWY